MKMKKIELGQLISMLANIGVFVGIFLLAFELHQNNNSLKAQSRYNHTMAMAGYFDTVANDSDISAIIVKAQNGFDLNDHENFRLWNHYMYISSLWQWEYSEELLGRIDAPVHLWLQIISGEPGPADNFPGMTEHWETTQDAFNDEFRVLINNGLNAQLGY